MNKPTFFLIGAAKSGTTSLVHYLSQHPDLMISDPKEPKFFEAEYQKGLDYYWATCFRKYSGERHAGDAAHKNARLPYVAKRIHALCPEAKLLMICRNPTDRTYSGYLHNHVRKVEKQTFEEAIDRNLERLAKGPLFETEAEVETYLEGLASGRREGQIRHTFYVDAGYYARHLTRFADLFGKDRIKVIYFEDLAASPQNVCDDIWRFLDLEPVSLTDETVQNAKASPAVAALTRMVFKVPGVERISPKFRAKVRNQLSALMPGKAPKMSPATRERLVAHFAPENARLAEFTGRATDHWNH
ncbi:MAG: sulfotransferase [Pseudomonadota bacterium]